MEGKGISMTFACYGSVFFCFVPSVLDTFYAYVSLKSLYGANFIYFRTPPLKILFHGRGGKDRGGRANFLPQGGLETYTPKSLP